MRLLLIWLILVSNTTSYAQLKPGFDPQESRELIALCNSFTYLDLYGDDSEILPEGYLKVYTSPAYGMDNLFQVYTHNNTGIINFRGSTANRNSWMENLYASMIPVKDTIRVNKTDFPYQVGTDTLGAVHAGYMLALFYLKDDLLKQIQLLNSKGIYSIIITGHSQGGALAQLTRAYLHYLPESVLSRKNQFKVYAFANPMIGNPAFCNEYSRQFCKPELSFVIHNPDDLVPRMPISYDDSTFWEKQLVTLITERDNFSGNEFAMGGLLLLFKDRVKEIAQRMSLNIQQQLVKELGEIAMPAFKPELNYAHTGNVLLISPTEYPLELKDSSILANDSLMRMYKRDANGVFEDKSLYKSQSWSLQHKPYNYYTAILKDYFPKEYARLEEKYFVMPEL